MILNVLRFVQNDTQPIHFKQWVSCLISVGPFCGETRGKHETIFVITIVVAIQHAPICILRVRAAVFIRITTQVRLFPSSRRFHFRFSGL